MPPGTEERDYYLGAVEGATPEQRAWVRERDADPDAPPADPSGETEAVR